jgi:hypothetical protein
MILAAILFVAGVMVGSEAHTILSWQSALAVVAFVMFITELKKAFPNG